MKKLTILPRIQEFEFSLVSKIIEDELPEIFKEVLKQYASTSIAEKYYTDSNGREWEFHQFIRSFDELYSLTKEFKVNGWGKLVPFGFDPGGWHFCISFESENYGKVVVNKWTDHAIEEQFVVIADSFSQFINTLEA